MNVTFVFHGPLLLPPRRLSWLPGQFLFMCVRDPQPKQPGCHRCLCQAVRLHAAVFRRLLAGTRAVLTGSFVVSGGFPSAPFVLLPARLSPSAGQLQLSSHQGVYCCGLAHDSSSFGGTLIVHPMLDFIPHCWKVFVG